MRAAGMRSCSRASRASARASASVGWFRSRASARPWVAAPAARLGADAVVGVDVDYESVGSNMLMVSASGTAVKLG